MVLGESTFWESRPLYQLSLKSTRCNFQVTISKQSQLHDIEFKSIRVIFHSLPGKNIKLSFKLEKSISKRLQCSPMKWKNHGGWLAYAFGLSLIGVHDFESHITFVDGVYLIP